MQGLGLLNNLQSGYLLFGLKRTFGQNFRELQRRSGLSGVKIAAALKVGPPMVAGWRNDRAGLPETPTLLKIAKVIRCTVDELLEGIDPEYDALRLDLTRQTREEGSTLPERGSVDVPASGGTDRALVERVEQLEAQLAETTEVANRLAGLLEQSGVPKESRSPSQPASGVRRRDRKTG